MAKFCYITGKKCSFGNNVSHSNIHTRRKFKANIHKHKIYMMPINGFLSMNLSTKGLRNIIKNGIFDTLRK